MARSHGGGGGGSHRSGSSSRSFGGSSSSRSHSSGSSSRRSSSGSSYHSSGSHSSYHGSSYHSGGYHSSGYHSSGYHSSGYHSGGYHNNGYYNNGYNNGYRGPSTHVNYNTGKKSNPIGVILLIIVLLIILRPMIFSTNPSSPANDYKPSVTRTKYEGAVDTSHGHYKDDTTPVDGEVWIDRGNEHFLINGFESFYQDTGIYPYLYLIDDVPSGKTTTDYSHEIYNELFGDCPGNFLILYISDSDEYYMEAGAGTGGILDYEAQNLIESILESKWEETDLAKLFGDGLEDAGKALMTPAQQKALASKNAKLIIMTIGGVIVLAIAGAYGYKFYKKKKQAEKEADERLEQILSTPLQTFDQANMESKYGDPAASGAPVQNPYGTPATSGAPVQNPYGAPATSGAPVQSPFEPHTNYGRYKDFTPGAPTPGLSPTNNPTGGNNSFGGNNQSTGNDPYDSIIPGATSDDNDY